MATLATSFQHSTESPRHGSQARKISKIKCIQVGKEAVKLSLSSGEMISYIENPQDSMKSC